MKDSVKTSRKILQTSRCFILTRQRFLLHINTVSDKIIIIIILQARVCIHAQKPFCKYFAVYIYLIWCSYYIRLMFSNMALLLPFMVWQHTCLHSCIARLPQLY